jgi:maleate cis-trans isomerase
MYGWRAKIGHVAPSRGDTLVYEFYRMLPEGFMLLNSTGTIRQLVDADFERQLQRIEEATQDLVENKCDAIIIGGSPLFTKLGYGSDIEMGKKLTAKFGVPVSPGITGEVEALRSLNIKKVVVATPHEDSLNQRMKAFLEASGFQVLKIEGYGVALARRVSWRFYRRHGCPCPSGRRSFAGGRRRLRPLPSLADDYRRGSLGTRDRQAGRHQLPGLHLACATDG